MGPDLAAPGAGGPRWIGQPVRSWRIARGHEGFEIRATAGLLDLPGEPVDVVHCLGERLGRDAAADAAQRFDLDRQVHAYLDWYAEMLPAPREALRPSRSGVTS